MTTGFNQAEGTLLSNEAHLRQSITDILTTPLGSRVLRRHYGSRLYELIDAPITRQTAIEFTVATADALLKWEPRIRVLRVQVDDVQPGQVTLTIDAEVQLTQEQIRLDNIIV
jgi:uncharacterized protein